MIMVRVSLVRILYMRTYVFVDDSHGKQATTLHETDTGELRTFTLGFLTRHLGPVHSWQTPFGSKQEASRVERHQAFSFLRGCGDMR